MNGSCHKALGMAAGLGLVYAQEWKGEERPDLSRLLLGGAGGLVGSMLPDLIEPASTPRHRGFFHSLVLAVAVSVGLFLMTRYQGRITAFGSGMAAGCPDCSQLIKEKCRLIMDLNLVCQVTESNFVKLCLI